MTPDLRLISPCTEEGSLSEDPPPFLLRTDERDDGFLGRLDEEDDRMSQDMIFLASVERIHAEDKQNRKF